MTCQGAQGFVTSVGDDQAIGRRADRAQRDAVTLMNGDQKSCTTKRMARDRGCAGSLLLREGPGDAEQQVVLGLALAQEPLRGIEEFAGR